MANQTAEKILLIENDPDMLELIARQTLLPSGYQVNIVSDSGSAIKQAIQWQPDLVMANLDLPGLSGKDLLVAFNSQGISTPVIVMTEKGKEQTVIQAFRLGASDYLLRPMRDTEISSCVERTMKQVRDLRARQELDEQLKKTNAELQRRVRELTIIFSVGRAVISVTDQRVLFEKIIEGMVAVSESDMGWLSLKDDTNKTFLLVSHRNLPEAWAKKVGQPLDDGLSNLVSMSAETLLIHGDPLSKFKISMLGKSAMVTPIKVQNEAIGLITVLRKSDRPFGQSEQTLSEAIADYASISLVNARLFRALAQNAETAQAGEKRKNQMLQAIRMEVQTLLQPAAYPLELMLGGKMGSLNDEQVKALSMINNAIKRLLASASQQPTQPLPKKNINS
jgi:two-component system NtrC family sensor kinase